MARIRAKVRKYTTQERTLGRSRPLKMRKEETVRKEARDKNWKVSSPVKELGLHLVW